jgi:replicative DNA helicase
MTAAAGLPVDPMPVSIEAEQALLGAILTNNAALRLVSYLKAEHFAERIHAETFRAIEATIAEGRVANPITLRAKLTESELAAGMTVSGYLARLAAEATTVINTKDYAQTVYEFWLRRQMISISQDLDAYARSPDSATKPAAIASDAISALHQLAEGHAQLTTRVEAHAGASALIERVKQIRAGEVLDEGVPTGFDDLNRDTGGFRPGTLWVIGARPGMGKAQPHDAKVHTPSGWRLMGDLRVGDALSSVDGAPSQVVGVFEQGVKPVFRVTLSDGSTTRACAEHLWQVRHRKWKLPRVLNTADLARLMLQPDYRKRLIIDRHQGNVGTTASLPIAPWLLGALLGNGGLSTKAVRFSTPDADTARLVSAMLPPRHTIRHAGGVDYVLSGPMGNKDGIVCRLRGLGLMGGRTETKFIPRSYLDAAPSQRLALLQGLMDTDGWVEKSGTALFSTASPQLAEGVLELARSLGFWARMVIKPAFLYADGVRVRHLDAHSICITGERVRDLFTLPRKLERLANRTWHRVLTVAAIEADGEAECRCIAVSHPSRLYVTDDHIVTHNTAFLTASVRRIAQAGHGVLAFSMEVPAEEIHARYLADMAYLARKPLSFGAIMRGECDDEDLWRLENAAKRLREMPLVSDVASRLSVAEIAMRVRAEKERMQQRGQRLRVVMIDYLKFIQASDRYRGQRVYEVGEISGGLKQIAKDEGICVVLLAQLNRAVESRDDKRPTLSDLRESGDLEADAHVVAFIYRESYYLEKSAEFRAEKPEALAAALDARNAMELIVGKNRSGPTRTLHLWCDVAASTVSSHQRGGTQ